MQNTTLPGGTVKSISKIQPLLPRNHSYVVNQKLKRKNMSVDNIYTNALQSLLLDIVQPCFATIVNF